MSEQIAMFKAAIIALVVAVLIWVWAEGESLSSRPSEEVLVTFPTQPGSDLVVRPVDPEWQGAVRVRLEGAVRAIDRVSAQLGREIRLSPELDAMPRAPVERVDLDLAKVIRSLPGIAGHASVIAEVQPAKVTVTAVRMVTRSLPVRVEFSRPLPLDGDAVPTPGTVDIRMPEPIAAALPDDAAAVAALGPAELARIRGDGPQTLTATLRPPERARGVEGVALTTEAVSVAFRIKQSLESVKLATVPVWYSLPPTENGSKWNIEILDKFLTDVAVTGPGEDVQRIRAGQVAVKALIEFSSEELERAAADRTGLTKQATFPGLPAGLSAAVTNPTVRVKVTVRPAAASGASPPASPPVEPGVGRLVPPAP